MEIDLVKLDPRDRNGLIREKGEFMLGLLEQCMGEELSAKEKSLIDRCVREVYLKVAKQPENKRIMPIISDFFKILTEQPEPEAKDLALSLEIFTVGSLNLFNHGSNVKLDNRMLVFGIRDMGKELAPICMLVMMECIGRRIAENAEKGRATWLYIDECHVLLDREYTAKYLYGLWKKVRKQGGLCTGITQNAIDLMQNYTALTMLANSEFIVLLKQSRQDIAKLSECLGISSAQVNYVTGAESGKGLMKHGEAVVPFDITVEKQSGVYEMFNTNLHEKMNLS